MREPVIVISGVAFSAGELGAGAGAETPSSWANAGMTAMVDSAVVPSSAASESRCGLLAEFLSDIIQISLIAFKAFQQTANNRAAFRSAHSTVTSVFLLRAIMKS
jgi:1-aminocyclopropane-1-carboxylate deaminase/D-cysteine desulfhydrase-like pyridoxal-dependent ACC family enzyme